MRGRTHLLLVSAAVFACGLAAAQGLPSPFPQEEVLVVVWKEPGRCSVLERRTTCARVPGLMNGPLQIDRNRSIVVATDGNGDEVRIRAAQLMTDIRAAGFRRVRPADPFASR